MDNNEIYEIANLYGNTNLPINAGSTSYSVIIGLGGSARLTIANSAITAAVDLNMSTKKLLNVATGSDSTDGVNKGQMDTALALKSDNSHTHDDRYHTEGEIGNIIAGYTGSSATPNVNATSNIQFKISGTYKMWIDTSYVWLNYAMNCQTNKIVSMADGSASTDACTYGQLTTGLNGKSNTGHTHSY